MTNTETRMNDTAKGWIRALVTHSALANANTPSDPDAVRTQLLCVIRSAGNALHALSDPESWQWEPGNSRYRGRLGDDLEGDADGRAEAIAAGAQAKEVLP